MKFTVLLVFALCCVLLPNFVNCYKQYITDARHPGYPNKCYAHQSRIAVTRGYVKYEGCRRWSCDSHYTMTKEGCDRVIKKEGCTVFSDPSQRYPGCCAKIDCTGPPNCFDYV